jgi:hypothetical protein
MGSSSGRNGWFKILVRQVFFLFVSGYSPPTGLDHQAYQEEAALLVPAASIFAALHQIRLAGIPY